MTPELIEKKAQSLESMATRAEQAGRPEDAARYRQRAAEVRAGTPRTPPPAVAPAEREVIRRPAETSTTPPPLPANVRQGPSPERIEQARQQMQGLNEQVSEFALADILQQPEGEREIDTRLPLVASAQPRIERELTQAARRPRLADLAESETVEPVRGPRTGLRVEEPAPLTQIRPSVSVQYPDIVPFQAGEVVTGRQPDLISETFQLRTDLTDLYNENVNYYVNTEGFSREDAERLAQNDIDSVLRRRLNVEGDVTSRGEGSLGTMLPVPPFFRETRVTYEDGQPIYTEPDTGTRRPASTAEQLFESLARQPVLSPEETVKRRQVRAVERELAFQDIPGSMLYSPEYEAEVRKQIAERADPFFETVFSTMNPQTGRVIETPLAAVFRSTGIVPTIVNESLMALPLFYDIDAQGNPDTSQFAYKAHKLLVDAAEAVGMERKDAEQALSGVVGGGLLPTGVPIPFSGIRRQSPTSLDPTGFRAVTETESIVGDIALSLAKGRFLGDELASIDGYTADIARANYYNNNEPGSGDRLAAEPSGFEVAANFYPLILGAGVEMLYGFGPVAGAARAARAAGRSVSATSRGAVSLAQAVSKTGNIPASLGKAAGVGELTGKFIEQPVEMSKRVKNMRVIQDLLDNAPEKPDLDLMMDASTAQRVASDVIAKDVLTPYLIEQAIASRQGVDGPPLTIGQLRSVAGDSKSGHQYLKDLGIDQADSNDALWQPVNQDRAAVRFRFYIHENEINAILKANVSDQTKTARIFALLADEYTLPTLGGREDVAGRAATLDVVSVAEDITHPLSEMAKAVARGTDIKAQALVDNLWASLNTTEGLPYPKVTQGSPVYQMLHEFGRSLAAQRPMRGPVAESYLRRLGELPASEIPEQVNLHPEVFREAAIGAGSRVVQATLENVVPSDLVFVTSTLMVPRQKLTPDKMQAVGTAMNRFERTLVPGPVVNGRQTSAYQWSGLSSTDAIAALGGPEAIRRSPLKTELMSLLMDDKPLPPALHSILEDALLGEAYRTVFRDEALEAVFAGAQTEQARVPTASLSAMSDLDAGAERFPRQSRPLAEAREPSILSLPFQGVAFTRNMVGSAVARAAKKYKSETLDEFARRLNEVQFSQTPVGYETALTEAKAAISSIPDNFQRELRDAAVRTDNPEQAFNNLLVTRMSRELGQINRSLEAQVNALVAGGMPREEAMSLLAYQQRAGTSEEALGRYIAMAGVVADAQTRMLEPAYNAAAENNWKQILQAFFGPSVYAQLLAPDIESLYPYIKTVVKNADGEDIEMFRPISTDNLREVIRLIRNDNPNLALRGAQAARFPGGELLTQLSKGMDREVAKGVLRGTDDAVFDVLSAWAMNKDKAEIAGRMAERVINDNPWMVVDLVPSMSAATGGSRAMAESQAALKARAEVLVALNAIGVEDRLTREALSGLYGYLGPGDVSRLIGIRIPPGEPSAIEVFRRIPGTPFMVPSEFTRELQKRVDAAREAFINQAGRGEMRKELREFIKQEKDLNEEIETMFRAVNSAYDDVSASLAKMAQADEKLTVNLARFEELKTKHADAISEYTAKLAEFAKKQKTPQASLFPVKPPDVLFAESRAGRAAEAKIIRAYNELLRGVFEQDTLPEKSGARRAVENLKKAQDDYFDLMKKLEDIDSRLPSARQEAAAVGGQIESQLTKIDEFTRFVLENQADEIEQHLQNVAARRIRPGRFTEDLDNMTVRAFRNLNSVARSDFVKYIYSSMLAEGTQNPDLLLDMVNKLDDPKLNLLFFEKQATTQNILKIMAQIDRTPQSQLTEADRALRDAINRARRAPNAAGRVPTTAAEKQARAGEIVEAVRRALLRNAMNSFVMPVVEEAQQTVRAYGWAPDMERTRQDMTLLAASFDPLEPKFMVAGQDFVESLQELQAAALDGRLATNMDALMRSDALARALGGRDEKAGRAAVQYVTQTLASVLSMPRTLAAGGMLAGGFYMYATDDGEIIPIPAPNTRYLGMNLLTAPFILATTLGFAGPGMAVGRLGPRTQANEVAQQFLAQSPNVLRGPLVDTISPGRMEDVLFTSTTGKTWTRGEVLEAINRNSVNISRGSLEFADSFARDLRRDARLTASGLPAGALRQYLLRNLDPTRTGIFQYVANATDKAIRQNVFASALRAGATEDQAAQLARASVLDYGKGSALGKQMNQYVLFLAFREAMIRETIESIARDPAALNRTILLHDRLSREMDSQLRADYALTRLPYPKTFVFDNSAAARVYGPVHPAIDMYADAVQFAGWVLQTGAKDAPAGVVAQAVADENLSPLVNYIIADFQKSSGAGRGGKVPDEWVAYAIQNSPDGLWAEWKEQFNIVPVTDPELMTPGRLRAADRPGEEKVEYRFETADDAASFARYLAKLQVLGFERTTADYTKLGLTYGVSDFIDPQKRGLPSTFGFATGLQTPMGEQSPESLQMRAIREQERALRAKQRAQ